MRRRTSDRPRHTYSGVKGEGKVRGLDTENRGVDNRRAITRKGSCQNIEIKFLHQ